MFGPRSIFIRYLLFIGVTVVGTHPSQASQEVSIAQCVKSISAHSVQVAQAVLNTTRAEAAREEANKPKLPQLVAQGNLAASSNAVTQANDANKAVIRIEQGTLPFGSAWNLGTQRALELEVSKLAQVETIQDVEMLVKQLYFAILRDQDTMANINLVESQFKRLMNDVMPRFQIGRAPQFDLVKVRSSIYDLARTREILRSQLVGERTQLAQIVGLQGDDWKLKPVDRLPEIPVSRIDSLDPLQNATFHTLNKQIEASEAAVNTAKAARLPTLSAALEYGAVGQTPTSTFPAWNGYAQLRFTFWDWGLVAAQVAQAQADSILTRKKLEVERQRISSDLKQTEALAEAHLDDQKRLQKLLPDLKRASDSSIDRYRRAAVGIIEATDATSLWLQNLLNERAAYYNYLSDLARLERVTGHSLEVPYGN